MDRESETRVWRRVQDFRGREPSGEDLQPVMQAVREQMAVYKRLSSRAAGRSRGILSELYEAEQECLSALKGVQLLRGGRIPRGNLPDEGKDAYRTALEKAYHRAGWLTAEYTARSAEPQWGMVFYTLAERERSACVRIAQALGE